MKFHFADRVSGFRGALRLCALPMLMLPGCILAGQTARTPRELLAEAKSLHMAGRFDQAIEQYRLFLHQYPDVAPVRSDLGAALAGAGRYEEAIVEYQRAIQLQPLPQIRLNLALAYYKGDKLESAVKELKTVRKELPNDLRPAMLLADCYLALGENKKVVELLDPLQVTHGDDMALVYLLGTALVRDGQVGRGQLIIDKILRNGESAEARALMGTTKLMVHDPAAAIEDLEKAIELNPRLPSVHSFYGRALRESADPEGAEKAFRTELTVNPNDFDANLYLGALLKEEQNYDEALPYLKHALEIRPGDLGVRFQIASLHLAQRRLEEAQRELEALVKESPDFLEPHVALARLYYRMKRKEDGDREQAIVERLNSEKQARDSEGQLKNKKPDEATTHSSGKPPG